ncbi:excinuclease ABC subunit UvrC, partial [Pediococcus pentosaceus]
YDQQIAKIKSFLRGNVAKIKQSLQTKMQKASEAMEFERAADIRDQIHYIEVTVEKQKIISNDSTPRDLFNFYLDKGWLSIQIFFIRQSRLIKREKRLFPIATDVNDELSSFILQFYNNKNKVLPNEILVPSGLDNKIMAEILGVPVRTPQRGEKKNLLELAKENAQITLEEKFRLMELDESKTTGAMKEITDALGIPEGHRIEAFDHSHIQGSELVSAMVVFTDGKPDKKMYRKFKLNTVDHADEAASTREVIRRRYVRLLKEKQSLPDLILMDGGDIQLNAAKDVLVNELSLHIPVAGMVKNDKHKTSDLIFGSQYQRVQLDPKSQGFYLVQRIQDEVHRFAITFHRQLHAKNSLASQLDLIQGVGPKTRNKLLKSFGSLNKIRDANLKEIEELGIPEKVAKTIKVSLSVHGK